MFLINLLCNIGFLAASPNDSECIVMVVDEPECPKCLIK